MAIIDTSAMYENARVRIALAHETMLMYVDVDENTVRRNKKRKNAPRKETRDKVLKALPYADEMLLLPYQTEQAKLCKHAISALQEGEPAAVIYKLIQEALAITGINEENYIGKTLIAQEPELLHTLAKLYAREGEFLAAIVMLENVLSIVQEYPPDEKNKELQIAPILLTLAQLQLQKEDFAEALETCEEGFGITAKRDQGKYCPDFLVVKVLTLIAKGDKAPCELFLTMAYAGYVELGNSKAANYVLDIANEQLGVKIQTHGMEKFIGGAKSKYIDIPNDHIKFTSLGHVLTHFHKESGLTSKEIYTGICDKQMFSKLKKDKVKTPNIFVIEALMQRMGRDINLYYNLLAPPKFFDMIQLRDRVVMLTRTGKYDDAIIMLKNFAEIESEMRDESNIRMQFIQTMEATIYGDTCDRGIEYLNKLQKALLLTIPHFNEMDIIRCSLTIREAVLIQQMAIHYETVGDVPRAVRIYKDLLHSIESHWIDRDLQSSMYTTVSFNYSSCLGRAGQRQNALAVIEKALEFGVTCGDLVGVCDLSYNKAYNLFELGERKDESLALFMLSYYGTMIFENHGAASDVQITKKNIERNFGILL